MTEPTVPEPSNLPVVWSWHKTKRPVSFLACLGKSSKLAWWIRCSALMIFTRPLKSAWWSFRSQLLRESADAIRGSGEPRHFARGADYSFPHRRTTLRPVFVLGSGSARSGQPLRRRQRNRRSRRRQSSSVCETRAKHFVPCQRRCTFWVARPRRNSCVRAAQHAHRFAGRRHRANDHDDASASTAPFVLS